MIYKLFLVADLIALMTAMTFFAIGLTDGSVGSFNIVIWTALMAFLGGIFWIGRRLRSNDRPRLATAVLGIVAIPALLGGLFMLIVLIAQPRWN
jgi:hypothetical protein